MQTMVIRSFVVPSCSISGYSIAENVRYLRVRGIILFNLNLSLLWVFDCQVCILSQEAVEDWIRKYGRRRRLVSD